MSDDDISWVETCDDCESKGYNCPLHDGPEWTDEDEDDALAGGEDR